MFRWAVRTDIGKVRDRNEDAYLLQPEKGLALVADGMGGGACGNLASRWIVEGVAATFQGRLPLQKQRRLALEASLVATDARIHAYMQTQHLQAMGATAVGLLINPTNAASAYLFSVGDSRLYRWRSTSGLQLLSIDHNLMNEFPELAAEMPTKAYYLTRIIGGDVPLELAWRRLRLLPGDRYLLCSDGVSDMLEVETLAQLMQRDEPVEQRADRLHTLLMETEARDNLTFILMDVLID